MKRILFVGDIHGNNAWVQPVADALDRGCDVVFVGDYLDSRVYTNGIDIYDNLSDIIDIKKRYPERIKLLLGNHDYNYMLGKQISGFDEVMFHDYHNLLNSNWDYFDLAWGFYDKKKYYLVTHAGLRNDYYKKFIHPEFSNKDTTILKLVEATQKELGRELELHEKLNFFKDKFTILWQVGMRTDYPMGPGSVIWADKNEILQDGYKGINQIIGHTPASFIDIRKINNEKDTLYFINLGEGMGTVGTLCLEF